jgi:uncharacterized protein (DUF488 family)
MPRDDAVTIHAMTQATGTRPFFTIGHSTRSLEEFVTLLILREIKLVVDVRTIPRSRTNPQFNSDELLEELAEYQIHYEHIATLGGLRGKGSALPPEANGFWKNQSFHNYADYATSEEFRSGLSRLRSLGHSTTCVIMCAEAVWWRCHRRIIADYLLAAGESVLHILGPGQINPARLTESACIQRKDLLLYPPDGFECRRNPAARS